MAITSARMQIKRGNEVDFDSERMLVGEWALSTDERIVRICVAPNVCIRMATYDAFEVDMAQIEKILEECQTIEDAVELINSQVSEKLQATIEYTNQAKGYRDEAKQYRDEMAAVSDIGLATTEKAGLVKPDGTTITIDADGTIHSVGTQGTIDYEELENKPSINGVELSGDNSLDDLGITTADSKDNTVTFSQADERENIITNENHATLFGKIAKWFSDLKTHAFVNPIANLLTTETGYALDATQGKVLDDKISAVSDSLSDFPIYKSGDLASVVTSDYCTINSCTYQIVGGIIMLSLNITTNSDVQAGNILLDNIPLRPSVNNNPIQLRKYVGVDEYSAYITRTTANNINQIKMLVTIPSGTTIRAEIVFSGAFY